jgi:hypothetical protein
LGTYVTATRERSGDESESARRRRMYRAALGVMWDSRFERSERNEDDVEDTVAPGTMVSLSIVARRPRWEVEVMSDPRADLSSWEALQMLDGS